VVSDANRQGGRERALRQVAGDRRRGGTGADTRQAHAAVKSIDPVSPEAKVILFDGFGARVCLGDCVVQPRVPGVNGVVEAVDGEGGG
jgi:hypothetical protein